MPLRVAEGLEGDAEPPYCSDNDKDVYDFNVHYDIIQKSDRYDLFILL